MKRGKLIKRLTVEETADVRARMGLDAEGLRRSREPSVGKVIEARRWVNDTTGQTASVYGAHPDVNRADEWRIETVGYTIRWTSGPLEGTVGCGRRPFKTREEADAFLQRAERRREVHA